MALDGTAWAGQFRDLSTYIAGGDDADLLVPVAGGDPVPFDHDGIVKEIDVTEAGVLVRAVRLMAVTLVDLSIGTVYTYGGESWTVEELDDGHKTAGAAVVFHYVLKRHVK